MKVWTAFYLRLQSSLAWLHSYPPNVGRGLKSFRSSSWFSMKHYFVESIVGLDDIYKNIIVPKVIFICKWTINKVWKLPWWNSDQWSLPIVLLRRFRLIGFRFYGNDIRERQPTSLETTTTLFVHWQSERPKLSKWQGKRK